MYLIIVLTCLIISEVCIFVYDIWFGPIWDEDLFSWHPECSENSSVGYGLSAPLKPKQAPPPCPLLQMASRTAVKGHF